MTEEEWLLCPYPDRQGVSGEAVAVLSREGSCHGGPMSRGTGRRLGGRRIAPPGQQKEGLTCAFFLAS